MNLYFTVEPMLIHNRIDRVGPRSDQSTQGWNAELWDVR